MCFNTLLYRCRIGTGFNLITMKSRLTVKKPQTMKINASAKRRRIGAQKTLTLDAIRGRFD
jgi:hypothetical protein